MQKRTFIRTMLDVFLENAMVKSIASFVNFCNEQLYYGPEKLKFLKKMPITNIAKEKKYTKDFLFTVPKC